ncbi:MAG: hypothetical protein M0R33_17545 [Methylomonas sp.]|jgi:hypothetical protein|uniref:hypothetical protein n=1 Tax=Methylomonas sp. TaxID=418 RepID=UPI0025F95478|nr:hypothetical protein [Methylomonas sp.]MCK9608252.1 hypothetical protein [Methylomonas sp.]
MRPFLVSSFAAITFSLASLGHADSHPVSIPEKVSQNILKRHPSAYDLRASHETHFGQQLLEVGYKDETGQPILELFTSHGHLLTNELLIEDFQEIYPQVTAVLKREFPQHEFKKAELIGNPNGVGEEYEIYLHAAGTDWKVSVSGDGELLDKQPLTP